MSRRSNLSRCAFLPPLIVFLITAFTMPCAAQRIHVEPQSLEVGTFFGDADLRVWGDVPQGDDVVIEVLGADVEQEFMRKGRRWELWMNVGEVDIEGVPRLYLLASSSPQLMKLPAATVPWGYDALKKGAGFKGQLKESEESRIFDEFIQLKESQELYGIFPGAAALSSDAGSDSRWEAVFQLNSRISPGSYRVCVWTVRNGLIQKQECIPFTVTVVGIPAYLSALAKGQPIFYGLLAVAMGIVLGLLSGILFTKKHGEEYGEEKQAP
jgi:hypothetical protein